MIKANAQAANAAQAAAGGGGAPAEGRTKRFRSQPHDLLRIAAEIVEAVWASHLVWNGTGGVLRENSEPLLVSGTLGNLYSGDPGTDGLQFKSVLLRHLRYLIDDVLKAHGGSEADAQKAIAAAGSNLAVWRERLRANAASVWDHAACTPPQAFAPGQQLVVPALFGYRWQGPCSWAFGGATATTQTAAIDAFLAAA